MTYTQTLLILIDAHTCWHISMMACFRPSGASVIFSPFIFKEETQESRNVAVQTVGTARRSVSQFRIMPWGLTCAAMATVYVCRP